jgi:hypothetical protein
MSPVGGGRPAGGVAAAVTVAAAAGVGLHTFGPVDAMHQILSDSVATGAGTVLLATACAALAVAAGLLAVAAGRAGRHGPVPALFGLWAAGLIALAVFPTNLPGTEVTASAVVHRYAAATAVAVPPLVALLLARTRRLRAVAVLTGAAAALHGLMHVPTMIGDGTPTLPFAGLWERFLLALVLLLVLLISVELQPWDGRSVTVTGPPWAGPGRSAEPPSVARLTLPRNRPPLW